MKNLGQIGEKFAANYLLAQNYSIVAANHINKTGYRLGEIDLIAKDEKGWYVFVEVKSRKGRPDLLVPEESITPQKIKKIVKTANNFLADKKELDCPWRIDAITVIFDTKKRKAQIKHIKHIRL